MSVYKMRKKHQRKINKIVKKLNKNIANDELWQGRFIMCQKAANYFPFEDGSGGSLRVKMECLDKKTYLTKSYYFDYYGSNRFFASDLFWAMNEFIVEECKVWEEEPRPSLDNAINYN